MKKQTKICALYASLLLLGGCNVGEQKSQPREMCMANLQEAFSMPDKEFRSAPLWVWNTSMTTDDVDRMLSQLKEQGFGGAFVHPRPGLETEYLSEDWFSLWQYSVEKGKELGLDIWIYDENSYPSGFAGGHVPNEMPESYNQGQCLIGAVKETVPDSCYMCLLREGDSFTDITSSINDYRNKKGTYYVYQLGMNTPSTWTGGFPYVDLMVKGVTEKFIDVTMKGYEKTFGKELGTVVKGVFTDEPNINIHSPYSGHYRWTPDLFETFQKRWGYDMRPNWPLLAEENGKWKKLRHDYYATLLQLFIDRWSKPWYEYTESKHLLWTGHYWEHGWPALEEGPDNMAMYAWHQMPAIDMLFNQYNDNSCTAQFGNVRSVKELSSVANQKGRVRTLSETYGGGGWDMSFTDFKRLGDWEFALGVNFMNQHLSHSTITGVRKYDYPPVFTSISPWWEDYHYLNDYFARLSLVLSQGKQQNDWLILEPTTTLWMYARNGEIWNIGNSFQQFITTLEKGQVEYDLGSEDIIKDCGSVRGDCFRIGLGKYHTVILPPGMENLERPTLELLKKFVSNGGRLIAVERPTHIDGEEQPNELENLFAQSMTNADNADKILDLYRQECSMKCLSLQSSDLFHHRRIYDDGQLLFFANASLEKNADASFSLPGKHLYRMDALTGAIYSVQETEGKEVTIDVHLAPAASALYFVSERPVLTTSIQEMEQPLVEGKELISSSEMEIRPIKDNAFNLDFCTLQVDEENYGELYTKEANSRLWSHFGMPDPWESAVQFRHDILDRDTFTTGNIAINYTFNITEQIDLSSLHFIVERPDIWEVSLNGTPLSYTPDTLLDARCGDYHTADGAHMGINTLTLHRKTMSIHAEIAPVMLLGNFSVNPAQKGWEIVAPRTLTLGEWVSQGYPEYPWDIAYRKTYQVADTSKAYTLQLGEWNGTDAQVWVNGKQVGIISFPPYQMNLSSYLTEGENEVEVRIIGSMKNLYGGHYSRDRGVMGPGSWNGVQQQASGSAYDLFDYGLKEDFQITF